LRVAQGANTDIIKSSNANGVTAFGEHTGVSAIKVGAMVVPTGADGTVWIHLTPREPRRFVPAWKILDGSVDPGLVKGNIVLVGTTAEGLTGGHRRASWLSDFTPAAPHTWICGDLSHYAKKQAIAEIFRRSSTAFKGGAPSRGLVGIRAKVSLPRW
jgi:hypothetical protein